MNSLSKDISRIPLHCNICPKRPDFSDVSHLLTHVASKGHLSNYYKMKVRGSTDNNAKRTVEHYDEWYEEWDLEQLMRERMSQKEKKRTGSGGGTSRKASSAATVKIDRSTPSVALRHQRSDRLRDNLQLLDPQLEHRLRSEPLSRSGTPNSAYSFDGINRSYIPMHMGHITFNGMSWGSGGFDAEHSPTVKQENIDSEDSDDHDDEDDDEYGIETRPSIRGRDRPRHWPSESLASLNEENNNFDGMANDNSKLKGVFWPGMDMFDSATAEMRRKRNQKKHFSVLKLLQATSEVVQPTECVYDKEGVLRKEREITGNPESEDSLIEGESEPEPEVQEKKRARRRPRPALQNKNVNTGRVGRSRGQLHHRSFIRNTKASYIDPVDDDEDDLTYGRRRPRKRNGLSIHRDNTGPNITFDNHPRPMHYLTSGYGDLQSTLHGNLFPHPGVTHNNTVPRSQQSSWGQVNANFRPSPKASAYASTYNPFANPNTTMVPSMISAMPNLTGNQPNVRTPQYAISHQEPAVQNNNHLFHAATSNNANWDFLGLDTSDFGILGPETVFHSLHETNNTANPLFFSPAKVEDDGDSTISAKSN